MVDKLRIGYLYDFEAYPTKGGNHRHAYELTQGFLMKGHNVSVIDDPTMPGVTNFNGMEVSNKRFIDNIDVLYIRIDARSTREWKILSPCMEMAKSKSIPIVWEINAPANESLAYSWLSGKTSTTAQAKESTVRRLRRWFHAARKIPSIYLEERHRKLLAKNVSAAICVSSALKEYAVEGLGIKNSIALPNGGPIISEKEIEKRSRRKIRQNFTVVYSGSAIYPWQGLDYLSATISLANNLAPDIIFVLAVNQRSQILPSTGNVIILEGLDRDEMLDEICCAGACVSIHPEYPWSKYNFHNSPMKLFEYMACKAPSISSNHGQMKDLINHGEDGLLCENNPIDILDKIIYLRDNPVKARSIGSKGWERIQSELNWDNNVTESLKCFDQVRSVKD